MKHFAIVDSPISHSLSPVIHRAVYAQFGIDADYHALEVMSGRLAETLQGEYAGFSVTMPLKSEAHGLAVSHHDSALRTGVTNTLLRSSEGWSAYNTDMLGLHDIFRDYGLTSKTRVTIVGAGATARSVVVALAGITTHITVMARSEDAARSLLAICPSITCVGWDEESAALNSDVVVTATPLNATERLQSGRGLLIEAGYASSPSILASRWRGPHLDGLELLVRQGAHQCQIFYPEAGLERESVLAVMRAALPSR